AMNTDTSIGTPGASCADAGSSAWYTLGTQEINVQVVVNYTGATITATSGNVTNTTIFTLDAPYRPSTARAFFWDSDGNFGGGVINTDGTVVVRSAFGSITNPTAIRLNASWLAVV